MKIKVDPAGFIPVRAYELDAGADLKSIAEYIIYPGEVCKVHTGVSVQVYPYHVGLIFSRSGQAKHGITLANSVGVIDSQYRGELIVMLQNNGTEPYYIGRGDRIAQFVLMPIVIPELIPFEGTNEEWNDTTRGTGGFGSTGN